MKTQMRLIVLIGLTLLLSAFNDNTKAEEKEDTALVTANFGQLKAAFMGPAQKGFLFTDKKYYRQNLKTDRLEKSGTTASAFDGMVSNADAALLFNNGKAYFFKGSTYYRYNYNTRKSESPRTIGVQGWKGVPKNVDAAVFHSNGQVYFFKGNKYYRYNIKKQKVDYTDLIAKNWKGVPDNIDAALRHVNGKTYFFKGNKYYRYSPASKKVDKEGTIGVHGWKGLSFAKQTNNITASNKNNLRLKVTLTRIKSIQARDRDNIADFALHQQIHYKTKGTEKKAVAYKIKKGGRNAESYVNKYEHSTIFDIVGGLHVREGDENHFINNSLIYEITPNEIPDKSADFKLVTSLEEMGGSPTVKKIAVRGKNDINVSLHEVLDYLQNPKSLKYGGNYFKEGRDGKMHEYGAFGDVMWMKKGSNNSLIGHLEFGANNKETYVRLYYRFELVP